MSHSTHSRSPLTVIIASILSVGLWLCILPDAASAQGIPARDDGRWGAGTGLPGPAPISSPQASAIAPGGEIYIFYRSTDGLRVSRWDGSNWAELDGAFRMPVLGAEVAQAITVGADGSIYVAGRFNTVEQNSTSTPVNNIARWTPQDQVWEAVGGGVDSYVNDIAVDATGRVVVAGIFGTGFENGPPVPLNGIGRWNPSAGTWEAFGGGLVGLTPSFSAQAFTVDVRGGDVVVAGEFEEAVDADGSTRLANGIIRWDDTAGSWQPLGQGLENDAPVFPRHRDLIYAADGSIYLAGDASDGTATPIPLEAFNPNGS